MTTLPDSAQECPVPSAGIGCQPSQQENGIKCRMCGSEIASGLAIQDLPDVIKLALKGIQPTICDACDEIIRETRRQAVLAAREREFLRICPHNYANTDLNLLPETSRRQWARAMEWQYGPKGVVLLGSPRQGKTRILWLMIQKMVMAGLNPATFTCSELTDRSAKFRDRDEPDFSWKEDLFNTTDALCIDDFGKFKATERLEADIFDLIEGFTAAGKPILLTTNGTGSTMLDKFSAERGPSIVGRIREFCASISFNIKP